MSLILMMIYWVVIPFLVFRASRWLFRRAKSPIGKGLVVAATGGLFSWFLWIAVGENMWLDHQVKDLCARDGGVKVYETVTLPAEQYNRYASRNWVLPDKAQAKSTDEYYYEREEHYYRVGNPQMTRSQTRIIRRSDGKVLGEYIHYGRGGGGLPGPWHGTSFSCRDLAKVKFETSIFVKGAE
ncbi:MAG: hypothetical protein ACYDIB_03865 [Desulfobulbia bacterium]